MAYEGRGPNTLNRPMNILIIVVMIHVKTSSWSISKKSSIEIHD